MRDPHAAAARVDSPAMTRTQALAELSGLDQAVLDKWEKQCLDAAASVLVEVIGPSPSGEDEPHGHKEMT